MKTMLALGLALMLAGCGKEGGDTAADEKDPFVQKALAIKKEMCACKDVDCGDAAHDKLERLELDLEAGSVPADARERFEKVTQEIRACRPK